MLSLPSDESFARIGWIRAAYKHAAFEWQYLSIHPWETPSGGTPPTGAANGYLSSNLPGFTKGAACISTLDGTGTGDTSMRAFATTWSPATADVSVRATFVRRCVNAALGSSVSGGFRGCAVSARVSNAYGIANAGTVATEYGRWLDAYHLVLTASSTSPTADLTAIMQRTKSNGTSLTSVVDMATHALPTGVGNLNLAAGVDISLSITDSGGDPYLTGKIHGYTVGGRHITVQLFTDAIIGGTVTAAGSGITVDAAGIVRDNTAARITTAGGCGFALHTTRDDTVGATSVEVTEGVTQLTVRDNSDNSVIYADDFTRVLNFTAEVADANILLRATSVHGDVGAWLNSGWTYGSTAATDNTADEVDTYLGRSVAGTTTHDPVDYARPRTSLVVPSSGNPLSRDFIALRPADFDYSQHRSFQFKPFDHIVTEANWTAAVDKYGVQVRGLMGNGFVATAFVAYLEPIYTNTASALDQTSLTCHLAVKVRTSIDGAPTYLGLLSKTLAGVDTADGAFHTIDYDCHVFENATDVGGPIVHTVTVDGAVVVFDTVGTYGSGLIVLADGRVLDTGAFGPGSSGSAEGFFVESTVAETDNSSNVLRNPAQVKAWTQGTLTLLDPETAPGLMPSYAWVDDEGASDVTGDLSDVMDAVFPVDVTHQHTDPVTLDTEIGLRHTRARATRTRRRWSFSGAPLSASARDTMEAFWAAHGVAVAFNWTPDGEAAVIAYFVEPPAYQMVSPEAWVPSVVIEELLP